MLRRTLGNGTIEVPLVSLGTVKFGRNTGVHYPRSFHLPQDREVVMLLRTALELGVNLLDTAPAYGSSEERLGNLLPGSRQDWLLSTKVGEEFDGKNSRFNYSAQHARLSLKRSLKRLNTSYLDLVLLHSNGNQEPELLESGAMQVLQQAKAEGWVRAVGLSHKTTAGGMAAVTLCDVIMTPFIFSSSEKVADFRRLLDAAQQNGCGVLLKKVLDAGHAGVSPEGQVSSGQSDTPSAANSNSPQDTTPAIPTICERLTEAASLPGVSSLTLGTIDPEHLQQNVGVLNALNLFR